MTPWYLESGPEICSHCEQPHALEITVHCYLCDLPLCPVCVSHPDGKDENLICPRCEKEKAS